MADTVDPDVEVNGVWFRKVAVTEWRAVSADGLGIAFSLSGDDERPGARAEDLRQRVAEWCANYPQYHLETWQRTYWVSAPEWKRIDR